MTEPKRGSRSMTRTMFKGWGCALLAATALSQPAAAGDWPMFGRTVQNLADNPSEIILSKQNVAQLTPKWTATVGGNVSARAAVVDGVAYFPDWAGNVWAIDVQTGQPIWHLQLSSIGLPAGTFSRTSPAVQGNLVFIGTQQGAFLVGLEKTDGFPRWFTQIDSNATAVITGAPAVIDNVV